MAWLFCVVYCLLCNTSCASVSHPKEFGEPPVVDAAYHEEVHSVEICDIYYDEKSRDALLTCAQMLTARDQLIFLYASARKKIIQKFIFKNLYQPAQHTIPGCRVCKERDSESYNALAATFSEDGQFLTVGIKQDLGQSQNFYVYKRDEKWFDTELAMMLNILQRYMCNSAAQLVQEYAVECDKEREPYQYTEHRTIVYHPTWWSSGAPAIWTDRFWYESASESVYCMGDPFGWRTMAMSISNIAPIGKITAPEDKHKQPGAQLIKPAVKSWWSGVVSPNKRYVIYYALSGQSYWLDRIKNRIREADFVPLVLDSTGSTCIASNEYRSYPLGFPKIVGMVPDRTKELCKGFYLYKTYNFSRVCFPSKLFGSFPDWFKPQEAKPWSACLNGMFDPGCIAGARSLFSLEDAQYQAAGHTITTHMRRPNEECAKQKRSFFSHRMLLLGGAGMLATAVGIAACFNYFGKNRTTQAPA